MKRRLKEHIFLILILGVSFALNIFSINWGLPSEWHINERLKIELVLNMASNHSLNPHDFVNPSFHLYLLLLILTPYFIFAKLIQNVHIDISTVYVICRSLSALMGTLTVFIVYLIGRKIDGRKTGIFAALFLAVTMGFVNIAHFAIPEATVTFLATLTILFCAYAADTGKLKYYLLAGACAGFAIATKYTVYLLVFPIFTAFFLNEGKKIYRIEFKNREILPNFMAGLTVTASGAISAFLISAPFLAGYLSPDGALEQNTVRFSLFLQKTGAGLGFLTVSALILIRYVKPARNIFVNTCRSKKILFAVLALATCFLTAMPYSVLDFRRFSDSIIDNWSYGMGYKGFSGSSCGWIFYVSALNNIFGAPLFCLCLAGAAYGFFKAYKRDKYMPLFLSWVIPFYIFLSANTLCDGRYILPIVPVLAVFAGALTVKLLNSETPIRQTAAVLVSLTLIYSFAYTLTLEAMLADDSRYKASRWITKNIPKGSTIDLYSRYGGYLPEIPAGYNLRYFLESEKKALNETGLGDFIILTSFNYDRYLKYPAARPERTKFYKELLEERSGYRLVSKFKFQGLLKPDPEGVDPAILIFKRLR